MTMPMTSKQSNQQNTFDEVLEKFKSPEHKKTKSKRPIEVVIGEDDENIEPV